MHLVISKHLYYKTKTSHEKLQNYLLITSEHSTAFYLNRIIVIM